MEEAFKLLAKRPTSFIAISRTNTASTHSDVVKYFRQFNLNLTRTTLHQAYDFDKPTGIWYLQVPQERVHQITTHINKTPSFIGLGPRVFATMVCNHFIRISNTISFL
jgi:hypothetical protein